MDLKKTEYSVLIVSSSANFASSLEGLFPSSDWFSIKTVSNAASAQRSCAERSFDFVLVNSPLSDESGIDFAIDLCANKNTVVLLMVRNELYDEIVNKVAPHGVCTLPKPISKNTFTISIKWMIAMRERLRAAETKTSSIEDKMKEIRQVNRAKWLLISELKMDEPAAHRYIEKQAMDRCVSKLKVAEQIIRTYSQ